MMSPNVPTSPKHEPITSRPPAPTPEESKRMMNALALLRVSTDAQDVARQRTDIEKLRRKYNLNIIRILELHGVSGTTTLTNEQVLQVLRELEQPGIDGLAASAVDRVFRPQRGSDFGIGNTFQDFRKNLWTVADGHIEMWTDEGWERFMSAGTRSGVELRKIRQRSIDGKMENAANGFRNSGSVPYGYRHVVRDKNNDVRAYMIVHEPEAEIVRRIFLWVLSGVGVYEIAKRLNLERIPSKRAGQLKNKETGELNSGQWSQGTVYQTVTNTAYMGHYLYPKGSPDAKVCTCPALVEEAVWKHAQLELLAHKETRVGRICRKYLLSGLCWCSYCGHRMTSYPRRGGKAWYRCGNVTNKPPITRKCTGPNGGPYFDQDELEAAVWKTVWGGVTNPDTLYRMVEIASQAKAPDATALARITELEENVAQLLRSEERAYENINDPSMPREKTKRHWLDVQQARKVAQFELEKLQASFAAAATPSRREIEAIARELAAYEPKGFDERRAFLQLLVKEIHVSTDEFTVHCHVSDQMLREGLKGEGVRETPHKNSPCGEYAKENSSLAFPSPLLTSPISFNLNAKL